MAADMMAIVVVVMVVVVMPIDGMACQYATMPNTISINGSQ